MLIETKCSISFNRSTRVRPRLISEVSEPKRPMRCTDAQISHCILSQFHEQKILRKISRLETRGREIWRTLTMNMPTTEMEKSR